MTITKEQQKENRKKWVAALRSGEYKQTTGTLCNIVANEGDKYCCLGVACELFYKEAGIKKPVQ